MPRLTFYSYAAASAKQMLAGDVERFEIAHGLEICRILNGMWQVAGGHGNVDCDLAVEEMVRYHDAGFTTWDLADIYGPAEDFIGSFREQLADRSGTQEQEKIQALTKWVPEPRPISRAFARASIDRSRERMRVGSIDLVQFHWWDYNNPYYIDALKYLSELRDEGKLKHVGLTNFDTERMEIMKDSDLRVVSNQVQYSVIDKRPEEKMARFCRENKTFLLAYGTLCGGLISEKYIGKPEPRSGDLNTLSLKKYKRMIDQWGNWQLFQELLSTLKNIAQEYDSSIANVATRYILDKPAVAGVIIGTRLGITQHREDNSRVFQLSLTKGDTDAIDSVALKANNLFELIGDCGDEYR